MTRITFPITFVIFLLFYGSTFSQNCKNVFLDKKDEFTGKQVKASKTRVSKKGAYEEASLQIDKVDDSLKLTFIYSNSDRRFADAGVFSCQKGDKIYLLLQDTTVLKLELAGQGYSSRNENAGVGTEILLGRYSGLAKSNKTIFEPEYRLDQTTIQILRTKKVIKIRVEAHGVKGDTGRKLENIELALEKKESDQFLEDVNCVLK
jgi:hypothetical protein